MAQTGGELLAAGWQNVDLHTGRKRGHFLVKAVPAGDLERDEAHLPRPGRDRERTLAPADAQHIDDGGAERDRTADRDGVDEAAVEVVLTVDLYRGKRGQAPRTTP